jgi:hypothetical protein
MGFGEGLEGFEWNISWNILLLHEG